MYSIEHLIICIQILINTHEFKYPFQLSNPFGSSVWKAFRNYKCPAPSHSQ